MDDRALQRNVLEYLDKIFPQYARSEELPANDSPNLSRCLYYLLDHDLISGKTLSTYGNPDILYNIKITAKGIDFLADDGGLSAILGVVTIKIHSDSIQELIHAKIEASHLPVENKSKLKEAIKNAPSTVVAEVLKRLTGIAFDNGPAALELLQKTFLGI